MTHELNVTMRCTEGSRAMLGIGLVFHVACPSGPEKQYFAIGRSGGGTLRKSNKTSKDGVQSGRDLQKNRRARFEKG